MLNEITHRAIQTGSEAGWLSTTTSPASRSSADTTPTSRNFR